MLRIYLFFPDQKKCRRTANATLFTSRMHQFIKPHFINAWIQWTAEHDMELEYLPSRHKLSLLKEGSRIGGLRLPWNYSWDPVSKRATPEEKNWVLFLIRAGIAAVGYFENGNNLSHHVFRAYMVRKKQGKSQIKYLKTKGKSRAGSRVRLGESEQFFREINEKVSAYLAHYPVDRIGYSCSKTLWPFLFTAGSGIQKDDPRLCKIPKHVQHPTYQVLLETNERLLSATLDFEPEQAGWFRNPPESGTQLGEAEDENW